MKSIYAVIFTCFTAVSVLAQDLSKLPQCARDCVGNSLGSTGCQLFDIGCICKSSGWITGLSCCIANKCSPAEQQTTITFADQLCQTNGVTLPSSAVCSTGASTTAASTGSSSAAGGATAVTSTGISGSSSGTVTSSAANASGSSASSSATAAVASAASAAASAASSVASAAPTPSTAGGTSNSLSSRIGAAGAAIAALILI